MTRSRIAHVRWLTAVLAALVLMGWRTAAAQSPPPVQGTIALEGTMKTFYRAANVVIVTTMDGVEHAYHFTRDLVVHGGKGSGVDSLEGLREGSTVVVHYTAEGANQAVREVDVIGSEGLEVTEGIVSSIDRARTQITVRYDNGKTEVFRLTDRAASEASKEIEQAGARGARVVVYYMDEHGQKVAHFFRKVEK